MPQHMLQGGGAKHFVPCCECETISVCDSLDLKGLAEGGIFSSVVCLPPDSVKISRAGSETLNKDPVYGQMTLCRRCAVLQLGREAIEAAEDILLKER